jgi:hypothetical protein
VAADNIVCIARKPIMEQGWQHSRIGSSRRQINGIVFGHLYNQKIELIKLAPNRFPHFQAQA